MEYKVIERYGKYYYQDKEGRIYGGRIGFNYIVGFDAAGEFVDGKAWFMVKREYIDRDRPVPELVTKEEYYVVNEGLRCVMWGEEAKEYAEQRRTQPTFPKTNLTVRCDESGYFFVNEKGEELFDERFAYAEIAKSGVLTVGRKQDDKTLAYAINKKGEIIAGPYSSLSLADRKGTIKKDAGNNSNNAEYIEFAVDEEGRCDDYETALELVKQDIRFLFKLSDRVYREYARKYELFSMKNKARCMNRAITESLANMSGETLSTSEQKSLSEKFKEGVKAAAERGVSIINKLKNGKASAAEAAAVTKAIERFKETGDSKNIRELFQERVRDAIKEKKDFDKKLEEGREHLYSGALDKELQEQEGKQEKERKKQEDKQEKKRKKQASKQEKAMLKQANEQEEKMHKQVNKLEEEIRKLAEELENISKESFDYYNNKD